MTSNEQLHIWEGVYETFQLAEPFAVGNGFGGDTWYARVLESGRACLDSLSSEKPIPQIYKQRSSMLPPVVAMMLRDKQQLAVADFGGGFGIGYMTCIESVSGARERLDYTVIEVRRICGLGRDLMQGFAGIQFVEEIPHTGVYDLIHSASALQYVEDWRGMLKTFSCLGAQYLLLSDVFAGSIPTFVTLQNYYDSRIRHWFFNYDELIDAASEVGFHLDMKTHVTARRLGSEDVLPMNNFPLSHRLEHALHLLFRRT